ncbi:MAG: tyrosine-type recombinase/integrase [Alicyclobacillus sp.]|nr:tyrosine-type recombinase/integrase [Alicyclobacillus sp.]
MRDFVGVFADLLKDFVAFKRSLGFKYENEADELYRFSKFTVAFGMSDPVLTKELVRAWSRQHPGESARNSRRRIYPVRQFGIYLDSLGHNAYIAVPDKNARSYTFIPYIFTKGEISRIFAASDRLYPTRNSTLPLIMPVILRMLYSCGLRISEALSLQNKHVNLLDGILEIKNSKFGKDRLVPMSDSMNGICRSYYRLLHTNSSMDDYFFMDSGRNPISRDNVYRRFREILWNSGISHGGKGQGPRLHDLRHTFAVHTLKSAVERGTYVYCILPILSTFLGHASVTATEQYVRLTVDAFPDVRAALERYCAHVIPQVPENEAD